MNSGESKMRLLLIVVDSNHREDVEDILDEQAIAGYYEVPTVLGKGATGRKQGSRAFPGSSSLFFTAINPNQCESVCGALKALRDEAGREEGLRVFALDTEIVL